jgi:arylsulfatase
VNDIVPTIYDLLKITPPRVVNGVQQDPFDGVSMAYSFNDAKAKGQKRTQYFEVMGSRALYHDGWIASVFGPRIPWIPGMTPGIGIWTPDKDKWELTTPTRLVAGQQSRAKMPEKVEQMKEMFAIEGLATMCIRWRRPVRHVPSGN